MTMTLTPEEQKLRTEATMREVYDLRVFIVGGGYQYAKMFYDAGFKGARSVDDASIICFTGGADVSPNLYGEEPISGTNFDPARDSEEAYIYGLVLGSKKPMIGICRGGQFLNVMNGGKMWQDVNNHAICGTHKVIDVRTGDVKEGMTSTHHQMMAPADTGCEILAVAGLSTYKRREGLTEGRAEPDNDDIEVLWYPDSLSLCFQPHPEFTAGPCRNYFLDLVDELILPAC